MDFLFPVPWAWRRARPVFGACLWIYDLMAGRKNHEYRRGSDFFSLEPALAAEEFHGGFRYGDATTDDAGLVLSLIREARAKGAEALNYAGVEDLLTDGRGRVRGVAVVDGLSGESREVRAGAVINATGIWCDELRSRLGRRPRLRPLKGSHLVFPRARLPLVRAVSMRHPRDKRFLYALPWLNVTLVGTTDLDHDRSLEEEPGIHKAEGGYLLEALDRWFPSLNLTESDVLATFAGIRPVVNTGKANPDKESRDHVVWSDQGLVTVSGGKLTTFAILAKQALDTAGRHLSRREGRDPGTQGSPSPDPAPGPDRTGGSGPGLPEEDQGRKLTPIQETGLFWEELVRAAREEEATRLDDLLLRRTRLGLLLPGGGASILDQARKLVQEELGWDDGRWEKEAARYLDLWQRAYSPGLISPNIS
jgi:glycerol-3-phosphate dehydrogenase